MLYVVLRPNQCPDLFLYRYIWFYYRYFNQLFKITRFNIQHAEFGEYFNVFKSFIFCLMYLPKTIMMEYNLTYKLKYDNYQNFIYN